MLQYKALFLLKTFDKLEFKNFKKWLSVGINTRQTSYELICALEAFHPTYENIKCTEELIFTSVFPGQAFSSDMLSKQFNFLLQALRLYIIQQDSIKSEHDAQITYLEYISSLNLNENFDTLFKPSKDISFDFIDDTVLFQKYQYEKQYNLHITKKDDRKTKLNYETLDETLDNFYLLKKLIHACQMLNRMDWVNVRYDLETHETLFQIYQKQIEKGSNVLKAWYIAYTLLKEKSKESYKALHECILTYEKELKQNYISLFYAFLENTAPKIYTESEEYFTELFLIYTRKIDKNILLMHGQIQLGMYKNICTVAIRLKKYDWAESFIETYKDKISPQHEAESNYLFCKAELHFYRKQYDKVQSILNQVELKDIYMIISFKRLQLKLFYELKEWNLLESHINSLRVFLHRDDFIDKSRIEKEKNFITQIKKLYKIAIDPKQKISPAKDKEEIESLPSIDKIWLLEQLQNAIDTQAKKIMLK